MFSKILASSGYSEIRVLNKVHVCIYVCMYLSNEANCLPHCLPHSPIFLQVELKASFNMHPVLYLLFVLA